MISSALDLLDARLYRAVWLPLGICLAASGGLGCHSASQTEPAHFASVEIHGNTPGQIRSVATEVFRENGYITARSESETMIFEKKGSKWDNLAYGDWMGSVWVRVEASLVPVAEATFRLQCRAYFVEDRGETTETDVKMAHLRKRPFQDMLEEIARRLGQK